MKRESFFTEDNTVNVSDSDEEHQENKRIKQINTCNREIQKFRDKSFLAAQNYSEVEEKLKISESNILKISNDNYELQKNITEGTAKYREELQNRDDLLVSVQQECNNQLNNIEKEYDRRNMQFEDRVRDYSILREQLFSQIMESTSLKKDKLSLKKEKGNKIAIRAEAENKYLALKLEIEQLQKTGSKILNRQNDIKYTIETTTKIGHEYRTAIALRSKAIDALKSENEKVKSENASVFVAKEKKKLRQNRALNINFKEHAENQTHLSLELEQKNQDEDINNLIQRKKSIQCRLQKANETIKNYEQVRCKWEETKIALSKIKTELETYNCNQGTPNEVKST